MNKAHTEKLKREYNQAHPLADPLKAEMIEDEELSDNGGYDSETWLRNRTPDADRSLVLAMQRGNANALKLFYTLLNRLVEKTEHKVELGLSADEITRRNLEAERQLRLEGYGMAEVSEKPPLLPEEVCMDNKQEHSPDS